VGFVGLPIQLEQSFALHLQFHLRILLETPSRLPAAKAASPIHRLRRRH